MMKGRVVWVFWLLVVLAVLTSTASYAWLAMNVSVRVRGIELEIETDSVFLEISADPDEDYDKSVSFDRVLYIRNAVTDELSLVTNGYVPEEGALRVTATPIDEGNATTVSPSGLYDGTGRYYIAGASDITSGFDSFVEVTDDLVIGQKIEGYYVISEESLHTVSEGEDYLYYIKYHRDDGNVDYACIGGEIPAGEKIAGRMYWGYAYSGDLDHPQPNNTLNIVSLDYPTKNYSLKKTVYLRGATGTENARDLRVSSVHVGGVRNYLTDSIRIMFVAESSSGEKVIKFYNHRYRDNFNGYLFSEMYGNRKELITVDMYIYFDGTDDSAYEQNGILTRQPISVEFTVEDHKYN